jgi:hypothetical protein
MKAGFEELEKQRKKLSNKKVFDRFESKHPSNINREIIIQNELNQKINEINKEINNTQKKLNEQLKENEKLQEQIKKQRQKPIQQKPKQTEQKKQDFLIKILYRIKPKILIVFNPLLLSCLFVILGIDKNIVALAFMGLFTLFWLGFVCYFSIRYVTKKIIK